MLAYWGLLLGDLSASRFLTILENLVAGLLVDFKDLINIQKIKAYYAIVYFAYVL